MLYNHHVTTDLRKLSDPIPPADANLHFDDGMHPHNDILLLAHPNMQCKQLQMLLNWKPTPADHPGPHDPIIPPALSQSSNAIPSDILSLLAHTETQCDLLAMMFALHAQKMSHSNTTMNAPDTTASKHTDTEQTLPSMPTPMATKLSVIPTIPVKHMTEPDIMAIERVWVTQLPSATNTASDNEALLTLMMPTSLANLISPDLKPIGMERMTENKKNRLCMVLGSHHQLPTRPI